MLLRASQCLRGMLVLDVQLSCQGVVSQCVCVESSSWFDSLNRPDHDTQVLLGPNPPIEVFAVVL